LDTWKSTLWLYNVAKWKSIIVQQVNPQLYIFSIHLYTTGEASTFCYIRKIIPARDPKQCGGSRRIMYYNVVVDDDDDDGDDDDDVDEGDDDDDDDVDEGDDDDDDDDDGDGDEEDDDHWPRT